MKMIRDNEENVLIQINTFNKGDLCEVLYAIIRRLNYLYDIATDDSRREAILDKKARILLYLIMMEEVEHEGKKLPSLGG